MKKKEYYHAWLSSFRLQTLPLAIATILIANALAYLDGFFSYTIFILTLLTAMLLQLVSNLANDYGDVSKKSDTAERIGPIRGIHQGLITLSQLKTALILSVVSSMISGLMLLFVATNSIGQWFFFIILGAMSIVAAITYTVGKRCYGYRGLGDVSVLIFFGFVGVLGSYYLQTKHLSLALILPAVSSGFLSVGVLNINNMRDYEQDKRAGKHTLVVKMGMAWAKQYQKSLLLLSLSVLFVFMVSYLPLQTLWIFVILVPLYSLQIYYVTKDHKTMSEQLIPMVRLSLATAILLSVSIIICSSIQ